MSAETSLANSLTCYPREAGANSPHLFRTFSNSPLVLQAIVFQLSYWKTLRFVGGANER
jgi:hypothetical protein